VPKDIAHGGAPRTPTIKVARRICDERRARRLIARWDTMAAGWKATRASFQGAMEPTSRSGWWRPSPAAGAACSSWRRASAPACWPAQPSRPAGRCSSPTARTAWSRRARRRRGGRATNVEHAGRVDRPPPRHPSTVSSAASATCTARPGQPARTAARAKPGGRVAAGRVGTSERSPWMKVLRDALVARPPAPAAVLDGGAVLTGPRRRWPNCSRPPASKTSVS
jgi:hypothetical protein